MLALCLLKRTYGKEIFLLNFYLKDIGITSDQQLFPAIFGEEIDRKWIMGDDYCYNGTDSGKNPLLKIEKSGRVSFSETDCYTDYGPWEMIDGKNLTLKSEMYCWTHTFLYQIQSNGLIDFVRKDTERWEE